MSELRFLKMHLNVAKTDQIIVICNTSKKPPLNRSMSETVFSAIHIVESQLLYVRQISEKSVCAYSSIYLY